MSGKNCRLQDLVANRPPAIYAQAGDGVDVLLEDGFGFREGFHGTIDTGFANQVQVGQGERLV
jgi:hypothetical protein